MTKSHKPIAFNNPYFAGEELQFIKEAIDRHHISGDGHFTQLCAEWLEAHTGSARALMTHSCTAALEMAALLLDIAPGDEVIMPSFTFVSTANAVALRGGVPVFVDVCPDTLNVDPVQVEAAVTSRTRAIMPMHYAGVACDMDRLAEIADAARAAIVEDAAHAIGARYKGRPLGTFGQLGALSFHETKNLISGEGGALLVNDPQLIERAEILRHKGTDRSRFHRGEVDKYTWQEVGSSFLPSDIICAFLYAQLRHADEIFGRRRQLWEAYHAAFADGEAAGRWRRPRSPDYAEPNHHLYYLLFADQAARDAALWTLSAQGINAVFHYQPLHASPAGRRLGRAVGSLPVTEAAAGRLLRLPLHLNLTEADQARVVEAVEQLEV